MGSAGRLSTALKGRLSNVSAADMQAGTLRRPGLLALEPSPFAGGEPRIRVRLEVEGNWDEAAIAERRRSHGEASTSDGDQSPGGCSCSGHLQRVPAAFACSAHLV